MKRKLIFCFLLLFVIIGSLGGAFLLYLQEKEDIYYTEKESLLYRYYYDYYYAHNKTFSLTKFLDILSQKDLRLYQLLKDNKIVYYPDKEGFAYRRYQFSDKFVYTNNFTFSKFLFSRVNIGIDHLGTFKKIDYEKEVIYQYENNSFIEKEGFNCFLLRRKYAEIMHCKNKWVGECDSRCNQAMAVIYPQEVVLMNSEFDKESNSIIKQVLKDKYSKPNDTLMVIVKFYNFKEAKCVE